jgi:hypothetical protein
MGLLFADDEVLGGNISKGRMLSSFIMRYLKSRNSRDFHLMSKLPRVFCSSFVIEAEGFLQEQRKSCV